MEYEGIVGLTDNDQNLLNIPIALPDANFVNMLRYAMLALSLLPDNSLSRKWSG